MFKAVMAAVSVHNRMLLNKTISILLSRITFISFSEKSPSGPINTLTLFGDFSRCQVESDLF